MTQVAADALGLRLEAMSFNLGDTDLPNISSPVGSAGSMMVTSAVHEAARLAPATRRYRRLRRAIPAPWRRAEVRHVTDGRLTLRDHQDTSETYGELLSRNRTNAEAIGTWRRRRSTRRTDS